MERISITRISPDDQRTPGTANLVREEDGLAIIGITDPVDEDGNPLRVPEGSRLVLHLIPRHITGEVPVVE